MSEEDVLGPAVREPLRSCCLKLASRLWALCQHTGSGFGDPHALQVSERVGRLAGLLFASFSRSTM
jgi:hypothetical protein